MKYEKPNLEELDLILEGSFLDGGSPTQDVTITPGVGEDSDLFD